MKKNRKFLMVRSWLGNLKLLQFQKKKEKKLFFTEIFPLNILVYK